MKAKFVYESLDFERGQDPKTSLGIGKFGNLIKELSEFYRDIFPSFNLFFENIISNNLDKEPHKFIIKIYPTKKNGSFVNRNDFNVIQEIIKEFGWESSDKITQNGFFPVHTKINNNWIYSKFKFKKPPEITLSYDEMSDDNPRFF